MRMIRSNWVWVVVPAFLQICYGQTSGDVPRTYVAQKATAMITIDGIADEADWGAAAWSAPFIDIEGIVVPKYRTRMKMLWDETYLYVYADMEEPHVWGTLKQRDTVIFHNNDFEIFIDPDGDTHEYMEFEMNALNTVWDLFLTKPYRNSGKILDNWTINGLQSAVQVRGTLNDPGDVDTGWSVEVALPWDVLSEADIMDGPPVGRFWRINFSRVNWQYELADGRYSRKKGPDGKRLPEYNWVWSPQGVINMHEPEHWGYVYFSPKSPGTKEGFEIPDDEHVKWHLYAGYRKLLQAGKHFEQVRKSVEAAPGTVLDQPVALTVTRCGGGWVVRAESPFTKRYLSIDQDGKFRVDDK